MSSNLIALQNRFLGRGQTVYDRLAVAREERGRPLSAAELGTLAEELRLPAAFVRSVAEFYDDLKLEEKSATRRLRVCNGEACMVAGAAGCRSTLAAALLETTDVTVTDVTCVGYCGSGPNALLESPDGDSVFSLAQSADRDALVASLQCGENHTLNEPTNTIFRGKGPADVLMRHFEEGAAAWAKARSFGAYQALETALAKTPEHIIEELERSQLRGRGGAGFPAGKKLSMVRQAPGDKRYVVCNADEGDAGAYIDKELMERDPHAVLEGMALAAYAVGADEGYIYLRAEYPKALAIMTKAVTDASEANALGANIFGTEFDFTVHIVKGHGAYICGEETSLLRSLEGVPALVSPKPPYPSTEGLRGKPTCVNNVETLAAFPWIIRNGGEAYAKLGNGTSRGTKLVSLNTAVARPGLYEVELGITLRQLIFERAGGMADGNVFKAMQIGGPLGGFFGEEHLDLPLDFDALADAGGMLGHAGIVVFPEDVDLVAVGRGLMKFCAIESCGKCFPCRIGSVRGTEIFDKILAGKGAQEDLELLTELGETMRYGSLCALGGAVPTPIENLMDHFIEDFDKYIPGATSPKRSLMEER